MEAPSDDLASDAFETYESVSKTVPGVPETLPSVSITAMWNSSNLPPLAATVGDVPGCGAREIHLLPGAYSREEYTSSLSIAVTVAYAAPVSSRRAVVDEILLVVSQRVISRVSASTTLKTLPE